MGRLCERVTERINETIKSIPCRDWIDSIVSSDFSVMINGAGDSYPIKKTS